MRTTHALNGFATLALAAALTACGGGGDAGAPLTPVSLGTLIAGSSAAAGTYLAEDASSTTTSTSGGKVTVQIDGQSTSPFILTFTYDSAGHVSYADVTFQASSAPTTEYICDDTTADACPAGNLVDTTARVLTLNNLILKSNPTDSSNPSVKLNAKLTWKSPV
jgi:hypothetical protein